jgi:prephenate dehydrogenase
LHPFLRLLTTNYVFLINPFVNTILEPTYVSVLKYKRMNEIQREIRMTFNRILIIGMGLIGGSIAAALKNLDDAPWVCGVDIDEAAVKSAIEHGYIDHGVAVSSDALKDIASDESGNATAAAQNDEGLSSVRDALTASGDKAIDLVILATPVSAAEDWLSLIAETNFAGVITDTASTKAVICKKASVALNEEQQKHYIPGHPMCGSEVNGLEGARATLFRGNYWILCPDKQSDAQAFAALHELASKLGARQISVPRAEHDGMAAIVSHVPHMLASSLVALAAAHREDNPQLLRLAAGGFKDTTRIAAGSPELWAGIALDNRDALVAGMAEFEGLIDELRRAIDDGDYAKLTALLSKSAELRRSIPAKWLPATERLVELRVPMENHPGAVAVITTIAAHVGCNIQSIDIEHITSDNAVLELILTDEGDIGKFTTSLLKEGFDFSMRPMNG